MAKANLLNLVVQYLRSCSFTLKLNQLSNAIEIHGHTNWDRGNDSLMLNSADEANIINETSNRLGVMVADNIVNNAIKIVSYDNRYNPFMDHLNSLTWDGVPRLDTMLIDHLGAKDTEYVKTVTRKTVVGLVARTFEPGIKFDNMLVLNGPQGIGKSTLFNKLVGDEYFTDSLTMSQMTSKDGAEVIAGKAIVEVSELAGLKKTEIEDIKAFLSRRSNRYRKPYAKQANDYPRRCIIVGTSNNKLFLRDNTGNRRFWPVDVAKSEHPVWELDQSYFDQILAEAVYRYQQGETLFLPSELESEAREVQKEHLQVDERVGSIEEYLSIPLPDGWDQMDIPARQNYINYEPDKQKREGKHLRMEVSNIEIWSECFYKSKESLTMKDSKALRDIMESMPGWVVTEERKRVPGYGQQRIYRRITQ